MSRFLMNSCVLVTEGTYEYHHVSYDGAREWLKTPFASRIRFDPTADAIGLLFGVRPPVDRTPIEMRVGDEALIFRLTFNVTEKRALTPEMIANNCEVGLLTRHK